jgi:peptidoglycan/xylan/chitin deacetylase (PgdA/CDA1 family)
MLKIQIPSRAEAEARWVCTLVLREFLGIDIVIETHARSEYRLQLNGHSLIFPDLFLDRACDNWLDPATLPGMPSITEPRRGLTDARASSAQSLPVLFGQYAVRKEGADWRADADFFGGIFFLLSRYEEAVMPQRDLHDRFPAVASHAQRFGYLDRPLVDEYVECLWQDMQRIWPDLGRSRTSPVIRVSCDVDEPFSVNRRSLAGTGRTMLRDLVARGAPVAAARRLLDYLMQRFGIDKFDPANTFDWIMDVNEAAGNRVAFYIMTGGKVLQFDGHYRVDDPNIRTLMQRIHQRGHEIGLHGSYASYCDAALLAHEANMLRQAMEFAGIHQADIGCRQHYLRWSASATPRYQQAAGFSYDSSLGYADHAGFRCGTCREYPMFDVVTRQPLRIRQRPLILMESSVLSKQYMNLGYTDCALDYMRELKQTCASVGGNFELLWHNSHFLRAADRRMYLELIAPTS